MSDNIEKDDTLTVSRVYDTLKSPTFLKNLYWDILSGIKEKNTYKFIRGMAERLINQNMEVLNGLNNSEADNMRRKTIVAEICSMSYAIDTVFSKILYIKLEKACRGQILNIIQQLRNEGKIPESVWSKFEVKTNGPEAETSAGKSVVKTESAQQKREVEKTPVRVGRRKRKAASNYFRRDVKKSNSNKEILEDLKMVNGMKKKDVNKISVNSKKRSVSQEKLEGGMKEFPKKNASDPDASTSLKKLTKENVSLLNSVDKTTENGVTCMLKDSVQTNNQADVSDAESEISVGHVSFGSVSPVHTSDLSSYDDEILLSSDDETGKKKKISLKEVQKRFCGNSNPDSSIAGKGDPQTSKSSEPKEISNKRVTEDKNKKNEEISNKKVTEDKNKKNEEIPNKKFMEDKNKKNEISVDDTMTQSKSQSASLLPNENGLPKRARKPNSRYASDNIICTVMKIKERKKSISHTNNTNETISSEELSPERKKSKTDNDIIGDVVTITQSINNEGSYDITPPKKQPETPDLCKSYSANRSLTSRRTAPVTLFST